LHRVKKILAICKDCVKDYTSVMLEGTGAHRMSVTLKKVEVNMSDVTHFGYNLGAMYLDLYQRMEDQSSITKENLLYSLQSHNSNLKDVSRLISAMTERKAKGSANFNSEPEFIELIDRIRENNKDPKTNQSILPPHQYHWNDERTIEIALQGLNDQVKIISQEVNHVTMLIQQQYQDMHSVAETSRKSCELVIEEIKSIQRRTGH
jgi:hypothetical protein